MTVWRERLDVTSNWAIVLATGLTTFTLGAADVPHYTLLLGLALIAIAILIEGRRYRYLHHSKWRLYLMERGFFADLLDSRGAADAFDWRAILAADLRRRQFLIGWLTAVRVRLRRNYLWLLYFMTAVWMVKLFIHPTRVHSVSDLGAHLQIGEFIPWWFVAVSAASFVLGATVLALTAPTAERLEDWSGPYGGAAASAPGPELGACSPPGL